MVTTDWTIVLFIPFFKYVFYVLLHCIRHTKLLLSFDLFLGLLTSKDILVWSSSSKYKANTRHHQSHKDFIVIFPHIAKYSHSVEHWWHQCCNQTERSQSQLSRQPSSARVSPVVMINKCKDVHLTRQFTHAHAKDLKV